jgi:hypothetical protein
MSGKTEPGEPGGRDTHSGTCATTTKDTDNVRGVEATETDEGDTLTPLGRPISRASVLQRMTSRASRRADANESTQLELLLRSQTRESGRVAHSSIRDGDGEKDVGAEPCSGAGTHTGAGVLETTAVVDLGNGPEEVCVIEWVDGDPEVSNSRVIAVRRWLTYRHFDFHLPLVSLSLLISRSLSSTPSTGPRPGNGSLSCACATSRP